MSCVARWQVLIKYKRKIKGVLANQAKEGRFCWFIYLKFSQFVIASRLRCMVLWVPLCCLDPTLFILDFIVCTLHSDRGSSVSSSVNLLDRVAVLFEERDEEEEDWILFATLSRAECPLALAHPLHDVPISQFISIQTARQTTSLGFQVGKTTFFWYERSLIKSDLLQEILSPRHGTARRTRGDGCFLQYKTATGVEEQRKDLSTR